MAGIAWVAKEGTPFKGNSRNHPGTGAVYLEVPRVSQRCGFGCACQPLIDPSKKARNSIAQPSPKQCILVLSRSPKGA